MPEASPIALDLKGKSRDELLELKLKLDREISSIRSQITRAQAEARKSGRYADPHWWAKVQQALRIKGCQCQQVQTELGRLRRSKKTVEAHFLDIARERMDSMNFKAYLETARRRAL